MYASVSSPIYVLDTIVNANRDIKSFRDVLRPAVEM